MLSALAVVLIMLVRSILSGNYLKFWSKPLEYTQIKNFGNGKSATIEWHAICGSSCASRFIWPLSHIIHV